MRKRYASFHDNVKATLSNCGESLKLSSTVLGLETSLRHQVNDLGYGKNLEGCYNG